MRKHGSQNIPWGKAAGFDAGIDAIAVVHDTEYGFQELRLGKRFAAAAGDAAAMVDKNTPVQVEFFADFFSGNTTSAEGIGIPSADLDALLTAITGIIADKVSFLGTGKRPLRARFHTGSALSAQGMIMEELRLRKLRLRIAAPAAAQRAAFEKHCGTDTRPILKTEMLDIKNGSQNGNHDRALVIAARRPNVRSTALVQLCGRYVLCVAHGHALGWIELESNVFQALAHLFGHDNRDTVHIHTDVFLIIKIFVYGNSKHYFGASGSTDCNLTNADEAFVIVKSIAYEFAGLGRYVHNRSSINARFSR